MAGQLFTYVITHDGGFAPNPFYGTLTLNCCKPDIRRHAQVGDWVAAFTAAGFPAGRGLLVYAMRVSQKMTMVEYEAWTHNHLPEKIPPQGGGLARHERQAGDSQYNFDTDPPTQRDGFHGPGEAATDLSGGHTLLSGEYYYFGGRPVEVPEYLRPIIHKGRAHKWRPNEPYVEDFQAWLRSSYEPGIHGWPHKAAPQGPQRVPLGPTRRKVGR
jgi:hypothetical protein